MVKAFLRFEKLTTELCVQGAFLVFGLGIVFWGLYLFIYQLAHIGGFKDLCLAVSTLGLLAGELLALRITGELALLAFRALKKYNS